MNAENADLIDFFSALICVYQRPAKVLVITDNVYSTLAKIEGDFVTKPGVQMIAKIAKALGVSIEDLLR